MQWLWNMKLTWGAALGEIDRNSSESAPPIVAGDLLSSRVYNAFVVRCISLLEARSLYASGSRYGHDQSLVFDDLHPSSAGIPEGARLWGGR